MSGIFSNDTVIISGGLGDIGRAIAWEFGRQGAKIAIGDLHEPAKAEGFRNELSAEGIQSHYTQVDVSDSDGVRDWIRQVETELGISTIIIANAAVVTFGTLNQITAEQWSRELRINLDGAFFLSRFATARLVEENRPGRVAFIGSWAAHTVHSHIPAYCVSKAGLRMLCKCLALELAPHNILVNELAPGYVDAGLSGRSFAKDPSLKEESLRRVPLKRLISAGEVAAQVVLLCHPSNRHMTGSTVLMDGGLSLQH